jgi:DNA-binding CsgD family transcriptional regulator/PAS domain-containing protein
MAVLTQHQAQSDRPDVLATFHMPDELAHGIANSIQHRVSFDQWTAEAGAPSRARFEIEKEHLPEGARSGERITFFCPVERTISLALSACRLGTRQRPGHASAAQEAQGWIVAQMRLLWQLKQERGRANMLAQVIDLFDFGTFLLSPDGNIVFANERARALLELGDGLRRVGQSVTATDFENAVRLQTAIQHLSHKGDDCSSEGNGPSLMLLRRAQMRPLVTVLARLSDFGPSDGEVATALFVLEPDTDTRPLAMDLCRAYGLTVAEASLVIRLVEGLTIDGAARDMHIQPQTARAYLKQIFAKTDTHRQADLVRVILGGVVRIRSSAAAPSNGGNDSAYLRSQGTPVWG